MRRALPLIALLVACTTGSGTPVSTGTEGTAVASTEPQTTSTAESPPDEMCAEGSRRFVASGNAGTVPRSQSDAQRLERVQWTTSEGCTRVEISFVTSTGAPAVDPPGLASAFLRDVGILRVNLGESVVSSALTEQALDGGLADRIYVVSALDGTTFVDLHLEAPAFARVDALTSPGRVVVELRAGGPRYGATPLVEDGIVVVDRPLGSADYPFSVSGYVRPGPGMVTGTLEVGGETVTLDGPHGDTRSTWGSFVLLVPDGPTGEAVLTIADRAVIELVTG